MDNEYDSDHLDVDYNDSREEQIILCIYAKTNMIAAVSFSYTTCEIQIMESVQVYNNDYSIINNLILEKNPMQIVTCTSSGKKFFEHIFGCISLLRKRNSNILRKLAPSYFSFETSREHILNINVMEDSHRSEAKDNINYILSIIDMSDERLVCALGALLNYINVGSTEPNLIGQHCFIHRIKSMEIRNIVWLDNETYRSLQIFDPVRHPSSLKWGGNQKKEGVSLFSILEKYCSPVSSKHLRAFMSHPINDVEIIYQRHEVIDFCINAYNKNVMKNFKSMLSQISPIQVISKYLDWPTAKGKHWISLYRNIYYCLQFAETCKTYSTRVRMFQKIADKITTDMYAMAHHLENILDLDRMSKEDMFVVKYGFYEPLDRAKERYFKITEVINRVTPYEFDTVPDYINKIYVMYIPEMGFLLVIPFWTENIIEEKLNLPNLQYKFSSNRTAYYKSRRCLQLDEIFGDPRLDIIREETKIIQALRNYLQKRINKVISLIDSIIKVDCIFALGQHASLNNYVKPEVVNENVLQIVNGMHPILSMCTKNFIPNNTSLSPSTSQVQIIYGPNASGKSIYLKQVAIIAYLVHLGSFVPATKVKIGLFTHILSRMHTYESVMNYTSSLLTEFNRLASVISYANSNTLFLFDEVGQCTSGDDNLAILASLIDYFFSMGPKRPHVLISTHLYGIEHCLKKRYSISFYIMDHKFVNDELIYLYKIKKEKYLQKFTFLALESACKDARIVNTAKQVYDALHVGENLIPYCNLRIQRKNKFINFIRHFVNVKIFSREELKAWRARIINLYYNTFQEI